MSFAEWTPTGRVTQLTPNAAAEEDFPGPTCCWITDAVIAGRYVALERAGLGGATERYGNYPSIVEVVRLDVRTGQHTPTLPLRFFGGSRIRGLSVTPAGTVAWIAETPDVGFGIVEDNSYVYVLPGNTDHTALLAKGPGVNPESLALVPGHLYWLEGGVPHTYAVP